MTGKDESVMDVPSPLRAARDDHDTVVKLTRELVRIPSRGGIDPYDPVLDYMASWLTGHDLSCQRLAGPRSH
jgi:succinyl-diaminopimelate desuccinylase